MGRYSISEIWKEDPDFEALARAVLDLVLTLESDPSKAHLLTATNSTPTTARGTGAA